MTDLVIIDSRLIKKDSFLEIPLLENYDIKCYKGKFKKEMYSRSEVEYLFEILLKYNSKPLEITKTTKDE